MRELYFKIQVDKGLKELDEGKGIPHQEVERRTFEKEFMETTG
jgi:predicted transcriptional regulator